MGRTKDPRPLQLKLRVLAPAGTTRAELLAAMDAAVTTGVLPDGFALRWIDWRKAEKGRRGAEQRAEGVITDTDVLSALKGFWGAMTHPTAHVRVNKVEGEG